MPFDYVRPCWRSCGDPRTPTLGRLLAAMQERGSALVVLSHEQELGGDFRCF
jgi:hypothetical protein